MVAILCVQFADKDTVFDARGGVGFSPALDTIEHKYRYEDYWNIIFQPSGNVIHPDSDMPDSYARGGKGFFQYGSLKRYMEDNSFGIHTVVAYQNWKSGSGILNTLTPDTSGVSGRSKVNWLTLSGGKTSYTDANAAGDEAIELAMDSLTVEWDSLDVVIIHFAGINRFGVGVPGLHDSIHYSIASERYQVGTNPACFIYPSVVFHEFLHAAKDAWDLHQVLQSPTVSGIGHYSLMGDNAMLGSYTPPMLDPWHRLRYGWLRYYVPDAQSDSLNLVTPIDTTGFTLPIVEQMYEGEPPYVIVIPIKLHPDSNGWVTDNRHYIIVENRRAVGWDKVIAVTEMETTDSSYGDTTGTGGFLVWSSWGGDGRSTPCWIYEADGGFETFKARYLYGAPTDLYGMPDGNRVFSVWSNPGVFHQATPGGIRYLKESRNLYIEFPEYSDSSNVNVIKRLVIDRFVPDVHDLDGGEDGEVSSTKFNTQQKIDVRDTTTLVMFHSNTETYVMQGPGVDNVSDVAWLENVFGEPHAVVDNGALAYFPDTSGSGVFSASYVWQQKMSPTEYKVRARRVFERIGQVHPCGNMTWGLFENPPHPVIRSKGQGAVIVFASDSGIVAAVTTDRGCTWTTDTLPGSFSGSTHPFVLFDTSSTAQNPYMVLFTNPDEQTCMYRSETDTTVVLSGPNHVYCKNPGAARLGQSCLAVYQCWDKDQNLYLVAGIELDLGTSDIPDDWDMYGVKGQDPYDVNHNPVVLYTDSSDAAVRALYWNFNEGEKLMFATNRSHPDSGWFIGSESTLSSKPTSYPHLLYHEPGNPRFVVSRSGRYQSGMAIPDDVPSVITMTMVEDLDANPGIRSLETQLGLGILDGSNSGMQAMFSMPAVVESNDTIAMVRYDYYASKAFTTEPVDTLTRSEVFSMTDDQAVLFDFDLSRDVAARDTLVLQSFLVDAASGSIYSSSGEFRFAPSTSDTSVTLGLELPSGISQADCYLSTSLTRGYFVGVPSTRITIQRYMLYGETALPKRIARWEDAQPNDRGLSIYPQPARNDVAFSVTGEGIAEVMLYDLLGRRVLRRTVSSDNGTVRAVLNTAGLQPGCYLLVVSTGEVLRTGKVVITR